MITVYGYDKDNNICDNLFSGRDSDIARELPWCAKFLLHHARSSKGGEYGWFCISKDNRDPEDDVVMCLEHDSHYEFPIIILKHKDHKEAFAEPDDIEYCDFDFINW